MIARMFRQLVRLFSLVLLSALGTIFLMRAAPGYFHDARELDPEYARLAREQLEDRKDQESVIGSAVNAMAGWTHGDFGRSTQFDVPVAELIKPRMKVTAKLLLLGVLCGWSFALLFAMPLGMRFTIRGEALIGGISVTLLAVPVGVLCTAFLLTDFGGPVTAISAVVAVRDFKLAYRLLRRSSRSAFMHYARAQGIGSLRLACFHLLPSLRYDLLAIGGVSIVLALSSIVPIEVLFDTPGLGHLAWSAALNRDLPVLTTVTVLMAACVGLVTIATSHHSAQETR